MTLRPEQSLNRFISIRGLNRRVIPICGMIGRGLRVRAGNRRFQMSGDSQGSGLGWLVFGDGDFGILVFVFWESVRTVEEKSGNFSSGKGIDWEVELGRGMVGGWP